MIEDAGVQEMKATALWERMRAEAEKCRLRGLFLSADEIEEHAGKLEAAAKGFWGQPQTHNVGQFLGTWARARRFWCNHTGEPLI